MRRLVAIFVLALFGLLPGWSIYAASTDQNLPACCRGRGIHHCAMMRGWLRWQQEPGWRAPATCPLYPQSPAMAAEHDEAVLTIARETTACSAIPFRVMAAQNRARRSMVDHAANRGPPEI